MKKIQKLTYKNKDDSMIPIGSWRVVEPEQVVMLVADSNYTIIHFDDGDKIVVATPLKLLETRFRSFSFFRLHKSYMVNLNYVKTFTSGEIMQVSLKNNFKFIVARRKRRAFRQELEHISAVAA